MSFQDKSLECSDCGATFTFSAEEQELFQSRGYTNEPPSAVPRAVRQGSRSIMEIATTGSGARCFPQYVPSAAKTPRYPSNPAVINRFTVAIATVKSD